MLFTFTIPGNQEDPKGNPIPYFRQTQKSKFSPEAQRYHAWQDYVVGQYLKQVPIEIRRALESNKRQPIGLFDRLAMVDVFIEWANGKHADGDNVFKGILDSLFVNDKNVTEGHFVSQMKKAGNLTVRIRVSEKIN